jgi:hypothetical protein
MLRNYPACCTPEQVPKTIESLRGDPVITPADLGQDADTLKRLCLLE